MFYSKIVWTGCSVSYAGPALNSGRNGLARLQHAMYYFFEKHVLAKLHPEVYCFFEMNALAKLYRV